MEKELTARNSAANEYLVQAQTKKMGIVSGWQNKDCNSQEWIAQQNIQSNHLVWVGQDVSLRHENEVAWLKSDYWKFSIEVNQSNDERDKREHGLCSPSLNMWTVQRATSSSVSAAMLNCWLTTMDDMHDMEEDGERVPEFQWAHHYMLWAIAQEQPSKADRKTRWYRSW